MNLNNRQKDILLSLTINEINKMHALSYIGTEAVSSYMDELREINHAICESFEEE